MYQILRNYQDELIHNEQVRESMNGILNQKANFSDVKKTMSEVVQNIESRASIGDVKRMVEAAKNETNFQFQEKVSFEDLNQYIKHGQIGAGNAIRHG